MGGTSGPRGIEVAADREHRVVGSVEGAKEFPHVVQRGSVEIFHAPDHRVVVRVVRRIDHGLDPLVPVPVRLVVHPPAPLVLHHAALVVQLCLCHGGKEESHAVRFQPESELEPVGRDGLEVVGAVQPGGPVHRAAHPLDVGDVLCIGDVLGALEHHVLEEMGEAGPPLPLVAAPHVVPEVHRHHRLRVVFREHHAQAVVQRESLDRDLHDSLPLRREAQK
jgi:hypothetical protein